MNRLYTENLSVGYGDRTILRELNVEIPKNKITVIIGANGCGKSTLLKSLTRVISDYKGSIILDGKEILKENSRELAKKMSILPQTPDITTGLTVAELISYGRTPYKTGFQSLDRKDMEVIEWAMKVTKVEEFRDRPVEAMSGGQRQRVWIAMALAQDTPIIFLDEPTTYLDLAHQLEILELLEKLNREQNKTIIMVLHELNQAGRFGDNIIAMKNGAVVKHGESADVITNEVLKEVFKIDAKIQKCEETGKPICVSYNLIKEN